MSVCLFVCVSVRVSVCVCVCVHDNSKNNGSIHLKLEHIVVYENSSERVRHWQMSDQGHGHGVTFKFFSIYHNTNCQVLYLSFGTCKEVVIKYMSVNQIIILRFLYYHA